MDFHSLSRRELQSLCMSNGIKANMTNIAMADSLKALQTVEGIGGTPMKWDQESPKTARRAASSRPSVSVTERHGSPLPRSRRVTARLAMADADVEEEKTVGMMTRRRTRMSSKKEAALGKSAPNKMADLEKVLDEDFSKEKDVVEEENGASKEEETKDIEEMLPNEQLKEDEICDKEENGVKEITQVIPNDQSKEELLCDKEEKEAEEGEIVEVTQVLPIEQSKEELLCDKERKEAEEEEIVEVTQVLPIEQSKEELLCDKEKQDEEVGMVEITQVLPIEKSEEEQIYDQEEEEIVELTQILPIEQSEEEQICVKEEEEGEVEEFKGDTEEESPIRGVVSLSKQQEDANHLLLRLRKLSLSESEVDKEDVTVTVSKVDFSTFEASEEVEKCEETNSDLIAPLGSDDNKENPIGGEGRKKKKIELDSGMSLRKLRGIYKKTLVSKKGEDTRSALKLMDENLLQNSVEDAAI